jgi:hypothetical protein
MHARGSALTVYVAGVGARGGPVALESRPAAGHLTQLEDDGLAGLAGGGNEGVLVLLDDAKQVFGFGPVRALQAAGVERDDAGLEGHPLTIEGIKPLAVAVEEGLPLRDLEVTQLAQPIPQG